MFLKEWKGQWKSGKKIHEEERKWDEDRLK